MTPKFTIILIASMILCACATPSKHVAPSSEISKSGPPNKLLRKPAEADDSQKSHEPVAGEEVCVLLSKEPASPQDKTMYVAFESSAGTDYFFAGIAKISHVNGAPILNRNNRIVSYVQAMRWPFDAKSATYRTFNKTTVLTLKDGFITGTFESDESAEKESGDEGAKLRFPDAPKIKDTIRKVLPIWKCLTSAQMACMYTSPYCK